jgi:hypothetical protein
MHNLVYMFRNNLNNILKKINVDKLLYATELTNYVKNDTIIDYLKILNKNNYLIDVNDNLKVRKRKRSTYETNIFSEKKQKTSMDYIFENGNLFEENIIDKIYEIMENNNEINKICSINTNLTKKNKLKKTFEILKQNEHNIIFGAYVVNSNNNTGGYPDVIVKGKWITKYINNPNNINNICNVENDKYYIIDIKSSIIQLINKGENISNAQIYKNYKMQIYVYKMALENMLFLINNSNKKLNENIYSSNIGFLLGKKYTFNDDKINFCFSSFEMLGVYNYTIKDETKLINAVEWHSHLNKKWEEMTVNPINDNYLYPNMKNTFDGKYKKIKNIIAKENKEITLMYYCGIQQRINAFNNNITNYNDKKITPEILGFKNTSNNYNILSKMIQLNKNKSKKNNIYLSKKNNCNNWQKQFKYEFYVDFETYYDKNECSTCLYMIGVGIEINNDYIYKCFTIKPNNIPKKTENNYIWCENEKELINDFYNFIINKNNDKMKQTRLIHWSFAEPSIFNTKLIQYNIKMELPWYDLLHVFKYPEYPIIIKECHSFGLKNIINSMKKYNYIDLQWNELDDGLLSSFIAEDIYNEKELCEKIIEIIEYNYIDCNALYQLLYFIRNYIQKN